MIEVRQVTQIDLTTLLDLYGAVSWLNYTNQPEMLQQAFQNSLAIYTAYEQDQLLGIVRVVGDGVSIVFVQDLLVYPVYQRRGIGTMLMNQVLADFKGVYQLHLLTEDTEKTHLFYQSLGFQPVDTVACRAYTYVRK